MNPLVGSDPEVMLEDSEGNLVNALNVVEGRKGSPTKLSDGAVIADNVNIEFNPTPASSAQEFVEGIRRVLVDINNMYPDYNLRAQTSAVFHASQMEHPESFLFGCEPEFDGWTGGICRTPQSDDFFRSCGGHVHIGSEIAKRHPLEVIQSMDLYVGLGSVLMDNDPTSPARQRLYGGSGKFRNTSYGVEYRTPGNFWLSGPSLTSMVFQLASYAVQDYHITPSKAVREVIDRHDKHVAYDLLDRYVRPRVPGYMWQELGILATTKHNPNIFRAWGVR